MAPKPKDTAPPGPLPEVVTLALGETADGRAAVVWLTTRGGKVERAEVVWRDELRERAESEWLEQAYRHIFLREKRHETKNSGPDLALAHGLGLMKVKSTWSLVEVETEGNRVTAHAVLDAGTDWLYMWERFDVESHRRLLRSRRRRVG